MPQTAKPSAAFLPPLIIGNQPWHAAMKEVSHPLGPTRPIWVRTHEVVECKSKEPQPSVPHPEWHPYCEINLLIEGKGLQYVGIQSLNRGPGDVLLMGPGTPHYAIEMSYPQRTITVFFLPLLVLEMGPTGDGARLLARCCGSHDISDHIIRLPRAHQAELTSLFEQIVEEFNSREHGAELRLRSLLIEILVMLTRTEKRKEDGGKLDELSGNWMHLQKALRFVHEQFYEQIYVKDIAEASGLSVSRLQQLFHATVGISCIQYLQWYRLTHAMALLALPNARVIEVAHEVGFETLSHFNASFRSFLGLSPSEFMRSQG